jgi:hypothetical protein
MTFASVFMSTFSSGLQVAGFFAAAASRMPHRLGQVGGKANLLHSRGVTPIRPISASFYTIFQVFSKLIMNRHEKSRSEINP